jgi:hypothetical protein
MQGKSDSALRNNKVFIETKLLFVLRVFTSSEIAPVEAHLPRGNERMTHTLKLVAVTVMLIVALSFTFERQAHAYVDPGSGLLLFQGMSATISGVLFYFRRRIKNLFVRAEPKSDPGTSPSPSLSE